MQCSAWGPAPPGKRPARTQARACSEFQIALTRLPRIAGNDKHGHRRGRPGLIHRRRVWETVMQAPSTDRAGCVLRVLALPRNVPSPRESPAAFLVCADMQSGTPSAKIVKGMNAGAPEKPSVRRGAWRASMQPRQLRSCSEVCAARLQLPSCSVPTAAKAAEIRGLLTCSAACLSMLQSLRLPGNIKGLFTLRVADAAAALIALGHIMKRPRDPPQA